MVCGKNEYMYLFVLCKMYVYVCFFSSGDTIFSVNQNQPTCLNLNLNLNDYSAEPPYDVHDKSGV